ncbi:MAG: flavin reductase family protein [Tannerellaceae bacterium]|nr:flavin reductase family protein [Tannerellaceae bacterium]
MRQISFDQVNDHMVDVISKEWMLITAGNKKKFNTMTANWGGVGYIWHKPVVFVFVRPERYTYEFMEANDYFTISFLGEENKDIHKLCGSKSGRDIDKVKETGLIPVFTDLGNVTFKQTRLTLECRKLYTDMIKEGNFADPSLFNKWYSDHGNPHKMYVAEIVHVFMKD